MSTNSSALEIYSSGTLTVIGFYGRSILEGFTPIDCRNLLESIARQHSTKTFAFDLTGVKLVPSGMLGLFASITKSGIDVLLFNAGPEIAEVLEITKLDSLLELFEVDVAAA